MQVTVTKLTDYTLMNECCGATTGKDDVSPDPYRMYKSEHSPIRSQIFKVRMEGIATFVSVHLVRHHVGVDHFVKSNRPDRGGNVQADRMTPVNHVMVINAQALISMARKRLCNKASEETRSVMYAIREAIRDIDEPLAMAMVSDCIYRHQCHELRPCKQHENPVE